MQKASLCDQTVPPEEWLSGWGFLSWFPSACKQAPPPNVCSLTHTQTQTHTRVHTRTHSHAYAHTRLTLRWLPTCTRAHTRLCSEAVWGARGRKRLATQTWWADRSKGGGLGPGGGSADLGSQKRRGREGASVSLETVNSPAGWRLSRAPSGPARPRPGPRPLWPLAAAQTRLG